MTWFVVILRRCTRILIFRTRPWSSVLQIIAKINQKFNLMKRIAMENDGPKSMWLNCRTLSVRQQNEGIWLPKRGSVNCRSNASYWQKRLLGKLIRFKKSGNSFEVSCLCSELVTDAFIKLKPKWFLSLVSICFPYKKFNYL